jgi:hypothetical protein
MTTQTKMRTRRMVREPVAADHIGWAPATLRTKRCRGGGPPYHKLGKSVFYDLDDVDAWLAEHRRTSTSEAA